MLPAVPTQPIDVECFNSENDLRSLINRHLSTLGYPDLDSDKTQLNYLNDYVLNKLHATHVLIENEYLDRHFIQDFSSFYVCCDKGYMRECIRIHFFKGLPAKKEVVWSSFLAELLNAHRDGEIDFESAKYLGFIVIKRLPERYLGRTCLMPYVEPESYPANREYVSHNLGLDFIVHTASWQEQDRATSACATCALWTVFQVTGHLFHHPIPTPVEITRSATQFILEHRRTFPSIGLTVEQITHAIRSVGLESEIYDAELHGSIKIDYMKAMIYGFLKGGAPSLLAIKRVSSENETRRVKVQHVWDEETEPEESESEKPESAEAETEETPDDIMDFRVLSDTLLDTVEQHHAVAITGIRTSGKIGPKAPDSFEILLKSLAMDGIYIHDDQVGPYVKVTFDEQNGNLVYENPYSSDHVVKPDAIIVPVHNLIRLPFMSVLWELRILDAAFEYIRENTNVKDTIKNRLIWDLYIMAGYQFKDQILKEKSIKQDKKYSILMHHLPKFIWRAEAIADNSLIGDIIFDATDIEQGSSVVEVVDYQESNYLQTMYAAAQNEKLLNPSFWIRLGLLKNPPV